MPWELLFNRLDRYVRKTHVARLLCGMAVLLELAVINSQGSPRSQRARLAHLFDTYTSTDVNVTQLFALAIAVALAGYMTGAVLGTLVNWLTVLVVSFGGKVWRLVGNRFRRTRAYPTGSKQEHDDGTRLSRIDRIFNSTLGVLVFGPRLKAEDIWNSLLAIYRDDAIRSVLKRHPSRIDIGDDIHQINKCYEYCNTWLKRHARDMAIPDRMQRFSIAFLTLPPVLLLPSALRSLVGDYPKLFTLVAIGLWFYAIYLLRLATTMFSSTMPTLLLLTFRTWVVAELLAEGSPRTEPKEPDSSLSPTT